MARREVGSRARTAWRPRSKLRLSAAACISCRRQSIIRRMSGCWSTNCATDRRAAPISTDWRRVSARSPADSEIHFEPHLGEPARELVEIDPADGRLCKEGGREIDLFVDLIVERRPEIESLPLEAARNEASVGAIVVRFRAKHQRGRQAVGERG